MAKPKKNPSGIPTFYVCEDVTTVPPSGKFTWLNPNKQVVRMQPAAGWSYLIEGSKYNDVGPQGQTVQIKKSAHTGDQCQLNPIFVLSGKPACLKRAGNPKIKVS